ncbi:uncharacterized protein LOC135846729 [Planococcus citri]|uniref:uncharacterized protein LOC135846729 n=1 Tax=Planococcus citri TaxID=170843 RepID=UPI0031F90BFD
MKLFSKKLYHALIAGLCWTSNSAFARANYADVSSSISMDDSVSYDDYAHKTPMNKSNDDFETGENYFERYDPDEESVVFDSDEYDYYSNDDDFTLNNTGKADMNVPPHLLGRTGLPMDFDSWENIHDAKRLFVDKTRFLTNFVNYSSQLYFFAKPRRFGKTLFLQTTQSFFGGEWNYFNGTNVSELGNTPGRNGTWIKYPVIFLDFAGVDTDFESNLPVDETMRDLRSDITAHLRDAAGKLLIDTTSYKKLSIYRLIALAYQKFNLPVVILIDEYDDIITLAQNTFNKLLLNRILIYVETFYKQIKSAAAKKMVKLALVTGVHKFAINSLQSGPNSFVDISWSDDFSTSIGFTKEEIETTFKANIAEFAARLNQTPTYIMKRMRAWYDGYHFGRNVSNRNHNVYNPISVINALKKFKFDSHWCGTLTSDYIVRKMYEIPLSLKHFKNYTLKNFDLEYKYDALQKIPLRQYMLQTGYLRMISYDEDEHIAILNFPNREIRKHLQKEIDNFRPTIDLKEESEALDKLTERLRHCPPDIPTVVEILNMLGFPNFKGPLSNKASEYEVTRRIHTIFNKTEIKFDNAILQNQKTNAGTTTCGKKIKRTREPCDENDDDNGNPQGDIDFFTTSLHPNLVVEIKVDNQTKLGYEQLLRYYINHYDLFRSTVKFQSRINLLVLYFHKGKNNQIYSWVFIPCKNRKIIINKIDAANSTLASDVREYIKNESINKKISLETQEVYNGDFPAFDLLQAANKNDRKKQPRKRKPNFTSSYPLDDVKRKIFSYI